MAYSYLVEFVVSHLLQISITIGLILLVSVLTLRRWPRFTFLLCVLGIAKCLVPPLLTSPVAFFTLHEALTHRSAAVQTIKSSLPDTKTASGGANANRNSVASTATFAQSTLSTVGREAYVSLNTVLITQAAGVIWLTGAIFLSSMAYGRWRSLRQAIRLSNRPIPSRVTQLIDELRARLRYSRTVRVVIVSDDWGPAVVGVLRPTLLLPESLIRDGEKVLSPVIAHELSHLRRMDTFWGLFQFAAQVIWWFHPAVWMMSRRTTDVCERCCDAEVLDKLGFTASAYANSLLRVVQLQQRASIIPVLGQMSARGITSERLSDLRYHKPSRPVAVGLRWSAMALLAALIIPGSAWLEAGTAESSTGKKKLLSTPINASSVRTAISEEEWPTAIRLLTDVIASNESNGEAWFYLGYSLHKAGRLQEAVLAHSRASEFEKFRGIALYNWGCALALLGQPDDAIKRLTQAADHGFVDCGDIAEDPDLASIRKYPEFESLRKRMSRSADSPAYHELDFLIGSWDVLNVEGEKTAQTIFRKSEGGYLIEEKWVAVHADGGSGTGISFYDPSNKVWKHTRIDDTGRVIEYSGAVDGSSMQMTGRVKHPNGECKLSRLTLELKASDLVVRRVENSEDDGASWTIQFTGTFRRSRT